MMELWADIKGFEGNYQVSTIGKVRAMPSMRLIKGIKQFYPVKELRQSPMSNGYVIVSLWKDGSKQTKLVHRLMAEAFINKPEGKDFINHKNGNKKDNRIENLEWCTRSENMRHAYENKLIPLKRNRKKIA